jgi:hypothetical protein
MRSFDIQNLAPGDIAVREVPINSVNLNVLGEVSFTSSVSILNQTDVTPSDNVYQSTYTNPASVANQDTPPPAPAAP